MLRRRPRNGCRGIGGCSNVNSPMPAARMQLVALVTGTSSLCRQAIIGPPMIRRSTPILITAALGDEVRERGAQQGIDVPRLGYPTGHGHDAEITGSPKLMAR